MILNLFRNTIFAQEPYKGAVAINGGFLGTPVKVEILGEIVRNLIAAARSIVVSMSFARAVVSLSIRNLQLQRRLTLGAISSLAAKVHVH